MVCHIWKSWHPQSLHCCISLDIMCCRNPVWHHMFLHLEYTLHQLLNPKAEQTDKIFSFLGVLLQGDLPYPITKFWWQWLLLVLHSWLSLLWLCKLIFKIFWQDKKHVEFVTITWFSLDLWYIGSWIKSTLLVPVMAVHFILNYKFAVLCKIH